MTLHPVGILANNYVKGGPRLRPYLLSWFVVCKFVSQYILQLPFQQVGHRDGRRPADCGQFGVVFCESF